MTDKKNEVKEDREDIIGDMLYKLFSKGFMEEFFHWKIDEIERVDWDPGDEELRQLRSFLSWVKYEDEQGEQHRELVQIVLIDRDVQKIDEIMFKFYIRLTKEFGVIPKQTAVKL